MNRLTHHLETCFSNQVYRSRDLAARASVPFMNADKILLHFKTTVDQINNKVIDSNKTHGLLLQVSVLIY